MDKQVKFGKSLLARKKEPTNVVDDNGVVPQPVPCSETIQQGPPVVPQKVVFGKDLLAKPQTPLLNKQAVHKHLGINGTQVPVVPPQNVMLPPQNVAFSKNLLKKPQSPVIHDTEFGKSSATAATGGGAWESMDTGWGNTAPQQIQQQSKPVMPIGERKPASVVTAPKPAAKNNVDELWGLTDDNNNNGLNGAQKAQAPLVTSSVDQGHDGRGGSALNNTSAGPQPVPPSQDFGAQNGMAPSGRGRGGGIMTPAIQPTHQPTPFGGSMASGGYRGRGRGVTSDVAPSYQPPTEQPVAFGGSMASTFRGRGRGAGATLAPPTHQTPPVGQATTPFVGTVAPPRGRGRGASAAISIQPEAPPSFGGGPSMGPAPRGRGRGTGANAIPIQVPMVGADQPPPFGGRGTGIRGRGRGTGANAVPIGQPSAMGSGNIFGADQVEEKKKDGSKYEFEEPIILDLSMMGDSANAAPKFESFTPSSRPVEEIYKEDEEHFEQYKWIAEDDEEVSITGGNVTNRVVLDTWKDAKLHEKLFENITQRAGYVRPRKIQSVVIPLVFEGFDMQAQSETGSGKTAAFGIPIIQKILEMGPTPPQSLKPQPIAIILEPTRELCEQLYDQFRKFSADTNIKVCRTYGQYSMRDNLRELNRGCDVLIATAGRFAHFIKNTIIELDRLKFVVLDEADHLFENSFLKDIVDTMEGPLFPTVDNRQTLLFSATFPSAVQETAARIMKPNFVFVTNMKPLAPNQKVVENFEKFEGKKDKAEALHDFLSRLIEETRKHNPNAPIPQILVFVKTRRDADRLALYLIQNEIKSTTVNGDRSQKDRLIAFDKFRSKEVNVLVATDVCARGLDVKDLDHVVNYDLPNEYVTYIHRIGRCGRLKTGYAHSFFDPNRDLNLVGPIVENLKATSQTIPEFFNQ